MTDATGASVPPDSRCPWCSSAVPEGADRCPSCGAALREVSEAASDEIPGVTRVDPVLGMRRQVPRPNRLVGWLADIDTEPVSGLPDLGGRVHATGGAEGVEKMDEAAIAPPSEAVRREMARLELAALKAEIEARAAEASLTAVAAGMGDESSADAPPASDAPAADAPVSDAAPRPRKRPPTKRTRKPRAADAAGANEQGAEPGT